MSIAIEHDTVSPEARVPGATEAGGDAPVLDIVIPVYNEQAALAGSVRRLHGRTGI